MQSVMPITGDHEIKSVPMAIFRPYWARAFRNHEQSLERLAARGGISTSEAVAILEDRPFKQMLFPLARERLREIVESYRIVYAAAQGSPPEATEDDRAAAIAEAKELADMLRKSSSIPPSTRYGLNRLCSVLERLA